MGMRRPSGRAADYGREFGDLVRFVRNVHEHPPRMEELGRRTAGSISERRALVAEYFATTLPELALAVHLCLEHADGGERTDSGRGAAGRGRSRSSRRSPRR